MQRICSIEDKQIQDKGPFWTRETFVINIDIQFFWNFCEKCYDRTDPAFSQTWKLQTTLFVFSVPISILVLLCLGNQK